MQLRIFSMRVPEYPCMDLCWIEDSSTWYLESRFRRHFSYLGKPSSEEGPMINWFNICFALPCLWVFEGWVLLCSRYLNFILRVGLSAGQLFTQITLKLTKLLKLVCRHTVRKFKIVAHIRVLFGTPPKKNKNPEDVNHCCFIIVL